ncbi:MAG TPA: type IV pilin protein [Burkholderiales bacterium]|nr:type IV pilin protein [Burkholderiales bacterium]
MQRHSGFTLIELMVTIAIVAILAAVAIPNYTDYLRRGKLVEGTSALLAMRTKMELYFQDNRTYVGACAAGTVAPLPSNPGSPAGVLKYFQVTCPVLTATTYTIQAAGGAPGTDGTLGGLTYTIDQANARTTTVTGDPVYSAGYRGNPNCWVAKKGADASNNGPC